LRRLAKELAVFAIHPQSCVMFFPVTALAAVLSLYFLLFLRRLAKALAVFAIHPQSCVMFFPVTALAAVLSLYFLLFLRRLAKALAVFAIHPQSCVMFFPVTALAAVLRECMGIYGSVWEMSVAEQHRRQTPPVNYRYFLLCCHTCCLCMR